GRRLDGGVGRPAAGHQADGDEHGTDQPALRAAAADGNWGASRRRSRPAGRRRTARPGGHGV
ncbi:MAG: hypothetical protein AVDCRST_MAG48-297, partial [uncultured Friedmanniella sp.]